MRPHFTLSALLVAIALVASALTVSVLGAEPASNPVGFRKFTLRYDGPEKKPVVRQAFLWYPTAAEERRFDYGGQIGLAAPDSAVREGKHPLVVFSHGFLGAGDQAIFLMEAFARHGYLVASLHHNDALLQKREKRLELPNFVDVKTWDETKHRDRRDDMAALVDYLLAQSADKDSFLAGRVNERAIGACGHSLGGYTVLGMIGGWDSWRDKRIKAALLLSPYALPFHSRGTVKSVAIPVMFQGGTLDWGITPFVPKVYDQCCGPKYFLVLKNETHFGWTNLISLGKTTTECIAGGNAQLMTDYSLAFLDAHLKNQPAASVLTTKNERLDSYQHARAK